MVHGLFGGQERSCQIVDSILNFNLEVRVRQHCFNQIPFYVWRTRKTELIPALVLPVPLRALEVRCDLITLVGAELEIFANVAVKSRDKRPANSRFLRVVLRKLSEQVVSRAAEAGIEASGSQSA